MYKFLVRFDPPQDGFDGFFVEYHTKGILKHYDVQNGSYVGDIPYVTEASLEEIVSFLKKNYPKSHVETIEVTVDGFRGVVVRNIGLPLILITGGGIAGYILYKKFKEDIEPVVDTIEEISEMVKRFMNIPERVEEKAVKATSETWEEPEEFTGHLLKFMRLNLSPYNYTEMDTFTSRSKTSLKLKIPKNIYVLWKRHPEKFQIFTKNAIKENVGFLNTEIYLIDQNFKLHKIHFPIRTAVNYSPSGLPVFRKKGKEYFIELGVSLGTDIMFYSFNFDRMLSNSRRVCENFTTTNMLKLISDVVDVERLKPNKRDLNSLKTKLTIFFNKFKNCDPLFNMKVTIKDAISDTKRKLMFVQDSVMNVNLPDHISKDPREKNVNYLFNYFIVDYNYEILSNKKKDGFNQVKIIKNDIGVKFDTKNPSKIFERLLKDNNYFIKIKDFLQESVDIWNNSMQKQIKNDTKLKRVGISKNVR